jgi:hypothetical protein
MKQLSLVFAILLVALIALMYWLNRVAVDLALTEIFGALFVGIKILFFVGIALGIAWCAIEIKRHSQVKVIRPGKHGPVQAIIDKSGVIHQLEVAGQHPQLDPLEQMALFQKFLQVQGPIQKMVQQTYVDAVPQTQIAPTTVTSLPAPVMTFRELLRAGIVQKALAEGQMVLGYVNGQLRYGSWFDLYSCGIGGVSGSGKTTTVRFLLFQAILATGKFVMIDPHIGDPEESLAAQFQMFTNIHALPPCDDEPGKVAKRIRYMFKEYTRRKAKGIKGPALVFVLDEFNEMIRRLPDELRKELADLLLTIAQGGRKFGIFAMIIGQRWSENDLGGKNYGAAIRSSLASVLAHRFTDEDQAKKLIGSKNGAKCLDLEQGHYFFRDTQGRLNETQTPYTVDEDGVAIQSILDGENTLENTEEFEENTPLFEDAENTTEPLQISDFKRETTTENTEMHTLAKEVMSLQAKGDGKGDIIRKLWGVNPGGSDEYKQAVQQYQQVMQFIAERLGA